MDVLIAQLWPYLAGLAGLIAGLFYARQSGKASARQEMDAHINKQAAWAAKEHRDVQGETAALDDDAIDRGLNQWVRGNGQERH